MRPAPSQSYDLFDSSRPPSECLTHRSAVSAAHSPQSTPARAAQSSSPGHSSPCSARPPWPCTADYFRLSAAASEHETDRRSSRGAWSTSASHSRTRVSASGVPSPASRSLACAHS